MNGPWAADGSFFAEMRPEEAVGDLRFFFGVAGAGSSVARRCGSRRKIFRLVLRAARRIWKRERARDRESSDEKVSFAR